jgi:chemotaxis protein CheD
LHGHATNQKPNGISRQHWRFRFDGTRARRRFELAGVQRFQPTFGQFGNETFNGLIIQVSSTLQAPPPKQWAAAAPKKNLIVGMGDMLVSNDVSAQLVTYSLGSCVGIAIYDPVIKVGGLLHAMLPDSTINPDRAASRPNMFVDTGLPAMFHAVYALGGAKLRMVVKFCGGAEFLDEKKIFQIGKRNIDATFAMLARNAVKVVASETGGHESRTLKLDLANGQLTLDIPGKKTYQI